RAAPEPTWSSRLFALNRSEQARSGDAIEGDEDDADVVGSVRGHQEHARYKKESRPPPVSDGHRTRVVLVSDRDEAVSWVRDHLGPGDAVLYENDLPDHFP
ncbi:MAG: hypothetical protein ACYCS7_06830, partial [Acidimicrobiales bacterium]